MGAAVEAELVARGRACFPIIHQELCYDLEQTLTITFTDGASYDIPNFPALARPPVERRGQQPPSLPTQRSHLTNYYRVTENLMLRVAPSRYSASALAGYPRDYIPEGTLFNYGPFHCTYGMYGQTNDVWCSVEYHDDGGVITKGWLSAHFLRDNYGVLLACLYATGASGHEKECDDLAVRACLLIALGLLRGTNLKTFAQSEPYRL